MSTDQKLKQLSCLSTIGPDVDEASLALVSQGFLQHIEVETIVTLHVSQESITGGWKRLKFRTHLQGDAEQTMLVLRRLRDSIWCCTDLLAITSVLIDAHCLSPGREAKRLDDCLVRLWNLHVHVVARATDFHIPGLQLC